MSDEKLYKTLEQVSFGDEYTVSPEERAILQHVDNMWSEAKAAKRTQQKILEECYLQFRSIANAQVSSSRDVERWGMAIFCTCDFPGGNEYSGAT